MEIGALGCLSAVAGLGRGEGAKGRVHKLGLG